MHRPTRILALALTLCLTWLTPVLAQNPKTKNKAKAPGKPAVLTADDVVALKYRGVSDKEILAVLLQSRRVVVDVSQYMKLKKYGASAELLNAVREDLPSPKQLVAAAVKWHKERRPIVWVLDHLELCPRRSRTLTELLPAVRGQLPTPVILMLRGQILGPEQFSALDREWQEGAWIKTLIRYLKVKIKDSNDPILRRKHVASAYKSHPEWFIQPQSSKATKTPHAAENSTTGAPSHSDLRLLQQLDQCLGLLRANKHSEFQKQLLNQFFFPKNTPAWLQVRARFYLAVSYLRDGNLRVGSFYLKQAIANGFQDLPSLQRWIPKKLWQQPAFVKFTEGIKVKPEDLAEMLWHGREQKAILDEFWSLYDWHAKRRDSEATVIQSVSIPSRATQSVSLRFFRIQTMYLQMRRSQALKKMDRARIQHLKNEALQRSVQAKPGPQPEEAVQAQQKKLREEFQRSIKDQAAAAAKRAFRLTESKGAQVQSPTLGQMKVAVEGRPLPFQNTLEEPRTWLKNPVTRVRLGDSWTYAQTLETNGKKQRSILEQVVQSVDKERFKMALRTQYRGADVLKTKQDLSFRKDLKEQFKEAYGLDAKIDYRSFKESPVWVFFEGRVRIGRRVDIDFDWDLLSGRKRFRAHLILMEQIPGMGILLMVIEGDGARLERSLIKCTAGSTVKKAKAAEKK